MKTYRLWSLWEMLSFNAGAFYTAISALREGSAIVGSMEHESPNRNISKPTIDAIKNGVDALIESLQTLGTNVALIKTKRLMSDLESGEITFKNYSKSINEIDSVLRDELSLVHVYALDDDKAKYFESDAPLFGVDVSLNFPSLQYDIDEAGKCLALGRSTASVFHSIRCLEAGFTAIWRCLGIADPIKGYERNWSNRLKKVEEKIEDKWPKSSGRSSDIAKFFDSIIGALIAMQNPYRNNTMHFDAKYTPDEAEHIFTLVKGIMKQIANWIDEKGNPQV